MKRVQCSQSMLCRLVAKFTLEADRFNFGAAVVGKSVLFKPLVLLDYGYHRWCIHSSKC